MAEYSGELLFIRPRSALALSLARTVHNSHHGQSAELHERMLSRMYYSPHILKYLHHLRSSCPTCHHLDAGLRTQLYDKHMGPLSGWFGVREFAKLPGKYLVADLWGPLYLAERRGTGSYKCWVVLFVDACTRMSSAFLTSNYGASGIGDAMTKHAQFLAFQQYCNQTWGQTCKAGPD
jgi:hypothetical protein